MENKIKRFLSLALAILMVFSMMPQITLGASAASTKTIYLNAGGNSLWDQANAWFFIHAWNSTGSEDVKMVKDSATGYYKAEINAAYTSLLFARKDPANTDLDWNNVWNQTADLTVSGTNNLYTITGWGGTDGSWSHQHIAGAAATCTTAQTCTVCSEELAAATGHNHEAVVTAPSCTAAGYTTYTCACGDTYTEEGDAALGHTAGDAATCGVAQTCTVCGEVLAAATGEHSYTSIVTPATCTEGGYTTYTCAGCGDSYTADETEATGHSHEAVVTDPTCTAAGYTTYTCACGDSYTADEVAATGHSYEAVVTAPSCTEAGYTTYTCACGDTYTADEVAANGHSYSEGVCTACGEADPDYVAPEVIDTIAELQAAIDAAAEGETITVSQILYVAENETVELDLKGKTVNLVSIYNSGNLTVKNGTLVGTSSEESVIETSAGSLTLESVIASGPRHVIRVKGGEVTIKSGTYKVLGTAGMTTHAVNVSGGAVTIEGGTFVGPKGTAGDSGTSVLSQGGTVIINGGSFSGASSGYGNEPVTATAEGSITIYGGTFDSDPSAYVAEGYEATETDGTYTVAQPTVSWYDADATELVIDTVAELQEFALITQGNHATIAKDNFKGKTVKLGADIDLTGTYWYHRDAAGNVAADYRIVDFAGTFDGNGKTISNIRLLNEYDSGSSVGLCFFRSVTGSIKNLTLDGIDADSVGNASVYVVNSVQNSSVDYGVENVHVKNMDVYIDNDECEAGTYSQVAGLVRWAGKYGKHKDSSVTNLNATVTGKVAAGGFSVFIAQNSWFENCNVTNFTLNAGSVEVGIGGFGAQVQSSSYVQRVFNDCDVTNLDITVDYLDAMVGGFLGNLGGMVDCDNCDVTGKITINSDIENAHVGGFAGDLGWQGDWSSDLKGHTFDNCTADVDITAVNSDVGGFVGMSAIVDDTVLDQDEAFAAVFTNCSASGDVTTVNGAAGGFVGSGDRGEYIGCTASGAVKGDIAGGFWGEVFSMPAAPANGNTGKGDDFTGVVITGSTASTNVTGTSYTAGLIGYMDAVDDTTAYTTPVTLTNNTSADVNDANAKEYAAQVGETKYETLAEAVAAANEVEGGATVELLSDVTLGEKLTISGNVTISGEYTITRDDAYTGTLFAVASGATLTLDGGLTIDGANNYAFDSATYAADLADWENSVAKADNAKWFTPEEGAPVATAYMITTSGTVNLNNVTIQNHYSTNGSGIVSASKGAVVTLTGAQIKHNASTSGSGLVVNASAGVWSREEELITVTMNAGTVIDGNHVGGNHGVFKIYMGTYFTMNGGEVTNTTGWNSNGSVVGIYHAVFTMNGGTICSNSSVYGPNNGRNAAIYGHSNHLFTMNGGTICHNSGRAYGGVDSPYSEVGYSGQTVINGGSIVDNSSIGGWTAKDVAGGTTLTITGGTFTQDVSQWLAPNTGLAYNEATGSYTVTEDIAEVNDTVYTSVAAAVEAANAGNTVKILASHKVDATVVIDKNITLDLNGNTILAHYTMSSTPLFRVLSDVTVTGEGKIDGRPGTSSYAFIVGNSETSGNLTIENGTFYGDTTAVSVTKGNLTINGGNFAVDPYKEVTGTDDEGNEVTTDNYNFLLNCIDANYNSGSAVIEVKGGTFYMFDPSNNAAEGANTSFVAEGYVSEELTENYWTVRAVNYVAQVGETKYESLQAAFNAVESGLTEATVVKVLEDHEVDVNSRTYSAYAIVVNNKNVILDMNGKTVTVDYDKQADTETIWTSIYVYGGSKLTITGEGKFYNKDTDASTTARIVWVATNGTATIENGSFVNETGDTMFYTSATKASATKNTELFIKGGNFQQLSLVDGQNDYDCFNKQDGTAGLQTIELTGGTFNSHPKEGTTAWEVTIAEGYTVVDNGDGTWTVKSLVEAGYVAQNVTTGVYYKTLDEALEAAVEGETVTMLTDIDYGTTQLAITKAITLDLGGHILTTGNNYGGMSLKNGPSIKNGTIVHVGNTAAIKAWDVGSLENLTIDVSVYTENKVKGGIVIQENAAGIDSIKNVTIKGEGLTNGIETYNCGNAAEPVIGSMENVTIDAKGTGMLISAPVGTATNCSISGGTSGIEIWIKGTYSATLDLVGCTVTGGEQAVYAHDEFSSADIENNGTLKMTADAATTLVNENTGALLTLTIARAENVDLSQVIAKTAAKVGDTYYDTLQNAVNAAEAGDTVTVVTDHAVDATVVIDKNITLDLNGHKVTNEIAEDATSFHTIKNQADLTIIDSVGGGEIQSNSAKGYVVYTEGGSVTIDGAKIVGINNGYAVVTWTEGDTVIIEEGTVIEGRGALYIDGGATGTVNGGTFTMTVQTENNQDNVVYVGGTSELTINGGTFSTGEITGGQRIAIAALGTSKVTINGGEFYGLTGDIQSRTSTGNVVVTGGTFTGTKLDERTTDSIALTGGTYSYNPAEWVAEGYTEVDNGDGTWTVWNYVEWIKAQLLAGNSVTLEKDIVVDGTYIDSIADPVNGNGTYSNYGIFNVYGDTVTFDLNGHTITYNGHADYVCGVNDKFSGNSCKIAHGLFLANAGANLTVKDSVGTGAVTVYGLASGVYACSPDSVITVEGGNWKNEGCATCGGTNLFLYASHGGELYIKAGTFEQKDGYLIVEHGGSASNAVIDYSKTKIEVSGGTFIGMNPEEAVFVDQQTWGEQVWGTTNVVAEGYVAVAVEGAENTWIVTTPVAAGYVAQNVNTGAYYTTVAAAVTAAEAGETVILLTDVKEDSLIMRNGLTLDLNGKTLDVGYAVAFAGNYVIDSVGGGLLKVPTGFIQLQQNNPYLPIYDAANGGYVFAKTYKFNEMTTTGTNTVKYIFLPYLDASVYELIGQGAEVSGVTMKVHVTWTAANGMPAFADFVYTDGLMKQFVELYETNRQAFTLNLTGTDAVTDLAFQVYFESDLGVQYYCN